MPRFSKDFRIQPSKEAYERASKTRSIKLRVASMLSSFTLKNVFTPVELVKLYEMYKTRFPTLEAFGEARAEEIIAYNLFRYITQYGNVTNAENALKVIKHLDVMSIDDLKETLNPVFKFDKYESQI
jgi:hypothetical protein